MVYLTLLARLRFRLPFPSLIADHSSNASSELVNNSFDSRSLFPILSAAGDSNAD